MTRTNDISKELVRQIGGDPNNVAIVRAISIWVAFESGSRILSNNPWNLRPGSDYNTCNKGPDSKNFTVFCSWQDGVKATAQRLSRDDYRGYRPIYNAIRRGDAMGFFTTLAKSKWSSDNYGGGGKLKNAFNSISGYNRVLSFGSRSNSPKADPSPEANAPDLGAWNDIIKFPIGKIINQADVDQMMKKLKDAGYFKGDTLFVGIGEAGTRAILLQVAVGRQWDKSLQDDLQAKFSQVAGDVGNPLGGISGALGDLAGTAVSIATYGAALALIIVGLVIYTKSSNQEGAPVG